MDAFGQRVEHFDEMTSTKDLIAKVIAFEMQLLCD